MSNKSIILIGVVSEFALILLGIIIIVLSEKNIITFEYVSSMKFTITYIAPILVMLMMVGVVFSVNDVRGRMPKDQQGNLILLLVIMSLIYLPYYYFNYVKDNVLPINEE